MAADELINEIYEIVKALSEQNINSLSGDTLSRLAVKLASYKATLGEYVSLAKREMWSKEAAYTEARAQAYKDLRDEGKGSTDADELKRLGASEAQKEWGEARYNAEKIVQLSIDCHDLIDAIKSRLIHLQTERSELNVH